MYRLFDDGCARYTKLRSNLDRVALNQLGLAVYKVGLRVYVVQLKTALRLVSGYMWYN